MTPCTRIRSKFNVPATARALPANANRSENVLVVVDGWWWWLSVSRLVWVVVVVVLVWINPCNMRVACIDKAAKLDDRAAFPTRLFTACAMTDVEDDPRILLLLVLLLPVGDDDDGENSWLLLLWLWSLPSTACVRLVVVSNDE